jgi:protein-L-isoaspartate(D-aspartate) O-methyltransferase
VEPDALKKLQLEPWDTADTRRLRSCMVEQQIVQRGIKDPRVLDAFRIIPRHQFVPEDERHLAYEDYPLPIGFGQTISQPYIVALMTEALQLRGNEAILEVGTGSAYQAAILALLAGHVHSIERIPELAADAAARLSSLGIDNVTVICQDGSVGLSEKAPFDAIIVTAAAPKPPRALIDQLAEGGRLIVPTGDREDQTLIKVTRHNDTIAQENLGMCAFVPLIGQEGWRAISNRNVS